MLPREESAGSSFLRRDGIVLDHGQRPHHCCFAPAEITFKANKDPGESCLQLTRDNGAPRYDRTEAPATASQKTALERITRESVHVRNVAAETILTIITNALADGCPIGGVKVGAKSGWFPVRPFGTGRIFKSDAESLSGKNISKR